MPMVERRMLYTRIPSSIVLNIAVAVKYNATMPKKLRNQTRLAEHLAGYYFAYVNIVLEVFLSARKRAGVKGKHASPARLDLVLIGTSPPATSVEMTDIKT